MQIKRLATVGAALGAGLAALTLAAAASPALAGGYWDAGNPAIYGGGYCPPPPPPPCECPQRYGYREAPPAYGEGQPPGYGYDDEGAPPAYGDDEGYAPSGYDAGYDDEGDGGVGGPGYYDQGYYGGGGPAVGVGIGLDFGGRDRGRFFDDRQRFFGRQRFDDRQRFDERQRFQVQQHEHVNVHQHFMQQQHMQQQHMQQPHMMQMRSYGQSRSYGHSMGGHGRW